MIRIILADDHTIVRMGLAALLGTEDNLEVVGQAKNGLEAVKKTLELKPDVVIMDLMMPKMDGIDATCEIMAKAPETKVIVLTTFGISDSIDRALKAGARGAILKNADNDQLASAIRAVMQGEIVVSPEIRELLKVDPPRSELTPRQKEILWYMCQGYTDKDIASVIRIRVDGVSGHVRDILTRLEAANRTEAVAIAIRRHLIKEIPSSAQPF